MSEKPYVSLMCNDPERWKKRPNSKSPAEEIIAYLEHAKGCPYHKAIEEQGYDLIRRALE